MPQENELTKLARILKLSRSDIDLLLKAANAQATPFTNWQSATPINSWTGDYNNPVKFCVVGDTIFFRGNIKAPSNWTGTANKAILNMPSGIMLKNGQAYMQSAIDINMGSAASGTYSTNASLDIFPSLSTSLMAWHGEAGHTYNLAGTMFTKA